MSITANRRPAPRTYRLRRAAAALAGGVALLAASALTTPGTATAADQLPDGLFGSNDPSMDGVWRQSIALLAQHSVGYTPAEEAVTWLAGQQCGDGSFLAYRPVPSEPCEDVTGADSNATALAAQALAALGGHDEAVDAALAWLAGVQNADGGWSYTPGGATDANSTAVVVGAFTAAGRDPAEVTRDDASPWDALAGLQLGCGAAQDERGAFAWQPDEGTGDLTGNGPATADAVLALYGSGLLVDPDVEAAAPLEAAECGTADAGAGDPADPGTGDGDGDADGDGSGDAMPSDAPTGEAAVPSQVTAAATGGAQLSALMAADGQHLVTTLPGATDDEQPDYGSTVKAVLALAAGGHQDAARAPLGWLTENADAWPDVTASPAALGMLILAAHATDTSATDFGGTDLVAALDRLGPAPDEGAADAAGDDEGGLSGAVLWIVGAGLVIGIVIGVLMTRRRARKAE
ncbi:hypothetical protein [Streptomyces avicenniae]|uniref:hypothetical protein n=1 Tax=Streptomyces avicenniae TaxID=500153 RepID=UPI00069CA470|nr:hypothetical protein [Streptomyces avicenniae]